MAPTPYKHDYTYITRDIQLDIFKTLKTVNKKTGRTVEEELLDYCRSPRSIIDLKAFLGIKDKKSIQARFTKPLMQQGKLKFIYPETPRSNLQRYLNTEVEITPELEETMVQLAKTERHLELERKTLKFCKVPRSLGEIKDHVGLAGYDIVRKRAVQPLIDQGKIKLLYPHDPLYKMQKYVVAESCAGYQPFTEEAILAYCETPRTKEEIKNNFAVGQDLLYKVLNPIIEQGKLIYTKSTRIGGTIIHKKLVRSKIPQEGSVEKKTLPSNEEIVEFCTTPRCYYEVRKAFAINDYTCRKIVNKLIEVKKLALTVERINSHRKLIKNG